MDKTARALVGILTAGLIVGLGLAFSGIGVPKPGDKQKEAASTAPAASGSAASSSAADGIFKQNCAACHGVDLKGGAGPNLTKIGSKLSKDQILKQIANGSGAMPGGLIKGQDADAVAAWLAEKK